jgi:hypothetical protein
MWWLRNTDSKTTKLCNFKTLWATCFNVFLRNVFWQMNCWNIHGFTRNLANI